MKTRSGLLFKLALAATVSLSPAAAQQATIRPAADSTGTVVSTTGNVSTITGGTTSSSGTNLFHSFSDFGLAAGQVASFQSLANIQNVLGRVTGGNASFINGLIELSGSHANLFLVNPAGIVFGPNASLNVPAAFTATTANGVGFGSSWFNATGSNDYAALNGAPGALGFSMTRPGAIVNAGTLAVGPGQALSLVGGTVLSTGTLTGSEVTVAAVPGGRFVRLGAPGSPLSIEVPVSGSSLPTYWNLPIYSLSELLTGTDAGLSVEDGTVRLAGSALSVEAGDLSVRALDAESASLTATRSATLLESQLHTARDLTIRAGEAVTLRDSPTRPLSIAAARNLTIEGGNIDIFALNQPTSLLSAGKDLTLRAPNAVGGDAYYFSGEHFRVEGPDGRPGNLVSLHDPVIRSAGDVTLADYSGASLHIFAAGSVSIGNVTIAGPDVASVTSNVTLSDGRTIVIDGSTRPTLDIRAGTTDFNPPGVAGNVPGLTIGSNTTDASITVGDIAVGSATVGGTVFLTNQYSPRSVTGNTAIFTGAIRGSSLQGAQEGLIGSGSQTPSQVVVDARSGASIRNINTSSASGPTADAGSITILANGDIAVRSGQTFTGGSNPPQLSLAAQVNTPAQTGRNSANIDLLTRTGSIFVAGGVAGNNATFTSPGTTTLSGAVNVAALNTDAFGTTVLGGSVTTVGAQTYGDALRLTGDVTLSAGGTADITFAGTVDSDAAPRALTVSAGGSALFRGALGSIQPLASLNVGGSGNLRTVLNGNVTTAGTQTYNSPLQIAGNLTLTTGNAAVLFGSSVNSDGRNLTVSTGTGNVTAGVLTGLGAVTVNSGGTTALNGDIQAATLTTDAPGSTAIAGNVTTTGDQTYNDPVRIANSLTVASSANGNIAFVNTVDGVTASTQDLNVSTGTGTITFGQIVPGPTGAPVTVGAVGGLTPLGNVTLSSAGPTALASSLNASSLTTDAGATGTPALTNLTALGGNVTTTGTQTYNDNLVIAFGSVLSTVNSNITFNGSVNGLPASPLLPPIFAATATNLVVSAGGGNISFNGPVGFLQPLASLTVTGANVQLFNIAAADGSAGVLGGTTVTAAGLTFTGNTYIANAQTYIGNAPYSISFLVGGFSYTTPAGSIYSSIPRISSGPSPIPSGELRIAGATFIASSDPITFRGPLQFSSGGLRIAGASTVTTNNLSGSGPLNIAATGNITTGNIATSGGQIALTTGGVLTAGTISSLTASGSGAPITITHQGAQFNVNTPATATPASSTGTITSSSTNAIASGQFTGTYTQNDIQIIGPATSSGGTTNPPPSTNNPPSGSTGTPNPAPGTNNPPPISTAPTVPVSTAPTIPVSDTKGGTFDPNTIPRNITTQSPGIGNPSLPFAGTGVSDFEAYYGGQFTYQALSISQLQDELRKIGQAASKQLAIITVDAVANVLTLITADNRTIVTIPLSVSSNALRTRANDLRREVADPANVTSNRYLSAARDLYSWLIAPLDATLTAEKVDTLIFQLDAGLRLLPLAALNDGKQFLVEKYSLSLIPSINLINTEYAPDRVRRSQVLAMGASAFQDDLPLPAVPAELQSATRQAGGTVYLNANFTLGNLKGQSTRFGIVHLATHADFNRGSAQNSYIKLGDSRLGLNQLRELGWNKQNIELLVLSACRTAFGDTNTELGFAGLAIGAGVKTAIATLWRSSDIGTFALMTGFYEDLKTAAIKADALRTAQLALLRGEVRVEGGRLRTPKQNIALPADLKDVGAVRLNHPYYWSGFTMIGSPW